MLVSSYSTYIDTSSTQRVQQDRKDNTKKITKPFVLDPAKTPEKSLSLDNTLPLNYISRYKALNTKQELQKQSLANDPAKMKFTKVSSIASAQVAYSDNSKLFSLFIKPKPTLDQTPRLDKTLPKDVQKAQENTMKNIMVNAYVANDKYYRITAA